MSDWKPLRGITVLDLTRMLPGGTATLLLADLGATVIKVEHPMGDETRYLSPRVGVDSSAQHQYLDRGKESIRIDLKTEQGRAQADWVRLLDKADTCVTPVGDSADLSHDSHYLARKSPMRRDSPAGPLWQVAPPLRLATGTATGAQS